MDFYNVFNERYAQIANGDTIYPRYKCEILSHSEDVIRTISDDMIDLNSSSMSFNLAQGTRRSCTLVVIDPTGRLLPTISNSSMWFTQKLKLYAGLHDIERGDTYWFAQGVYYVTNPTLDRGGKKVTLNCVDKFGLFDGSLNRNQLNGSYTIPAGSLASDAIRDILMLDMGGYVCDPRQAILDRSVYETYLPYDIVKSPGEFMGAFLTEIATVLGCNTYYDTDGHFCMQKVSESMPYAFAGASWTFHDGEAGYDSVTNTIDLVNAINIVKVVSSNVNSANYYSYEAKNVNPRSPLNIGAIGDKSMYIESATIFSAQNAKEYAELLLTQRSMLTATLSFDTAMLPHLDVDMVINISDKHFGYERERFVIKELTVPLGYNSPMRITASNVGMLPGYELIQSEAANSAPESISFGLYDKYGDAVTDISSNTLYVLGTSIYVSAYSTEEMDDFIDEVLN